MQVSKRSLTSAALTTVIGVAVMLGASSATAGNRKWPRPTPPITAPPTTAAPVGPPTAKAPVYGGTFDIAANLANCTVPAFTAGVTNWLVFVDAALAAGCRVHFNQVNSTNPVGTVTGFGAYLGPEPVDGYLPSAYTSTAGVGSVLPGGSLLIGGVTGINIYRPHW